MSRPHPIGLRTAGYGRCSDDSQEERSIPDQVAEIERLARAGTHELAKTFTDAGVTGRKIKTRPGLQKLLEFVEAEQRRGSPIQAVISWLPSRVSRAGILRTMGLMAELQDHGIGWLITNRQTFDLFDD